MDKRTSNFKNRIVKLHITLKIGLIVLVLGCGPILLLLLADKLGLAEAGNAMGPGLLAFVSFWPSIILIIIGLIMTFIQRKKRNRSTIND